jgi:RNA polymerase sigma-70 factor (ECF subfamily)
MIMATRPIDAGRETDPESFNALFAPYLNQMYRTAFRVLRHRQDAEDAVQDALLAAFVHFSQFEGRSQFSTWLRRIVLNAAVTRLRRNRARPVCEMDDEFRLDEWVASSEPDPEAIYARHERATILRRSLQSLPEKYASAVSGRFLEELTTEEAAQSLGVGREALKTRIHRGLAHLRPDRRLVALA